MCPEFCSRPSRSRVHGSDWLLRCSAEMGSSQSWYWMLEWSLSESMMRDPQRAWIDRVVARRTMPVAQKWYQLVILWIDAGIIAIPLFKINIHHLVSASGLIPSFPGQKWMTRLNPERYSDQHACWCMRILVVEKYCNSGDRWPHWLEVQSLWDNVTIIWNLQKSWVAFIVDIVVEFQAENDQEWNAIGCNLPFGVMIERTAASA